MSPEHDNIEAPDIPEGSKLSRPYHNDSQWQSTVEKVVKAVVSIHFTLVDDFDTEPSGCGEATGFIVDAERGIILTNRHVVSPGPFVGYAVFDNHEECEVNPIYRDPVHDFGFLRFDPKAIKYMEVRELQLHPELVKVGCEIRVIGNDSGEKLSILAGFISRLDRNAPDYGEASYNDFNTEYIQAAAAASGGSSGSPVVDIDGNALALQAGGSSESSTDFFLPITRVLRALKCLQQEEPITRGTIQVKWTLQPFEMCNRLGLTAETEGMMRGKFPTTNGLLVASISLPEGPADTLVKEGDCLIAINDHYIASFVTVDEILDSSVGESIELWIQRGGEDLRVTCTVQDLHGITPSKYVNVCGATLNDLSYQLASIYCIPVRGCHLSYAGGSFMLSTTVTRGWIIDSLDNKETPDLDTFIEVMKSIPDSSFVPIKYHHLSDLHVPYFNNVLIDRHWNKDFRLATRNDKTGIWDFTDLQKTPLPPPTLKPMSAKFLDLPTELGYKTLPRSFGLVTTSYPLPLDSFSDDDRKVYGVIIDAEEGYLLVSRYGVVHDLCDINVTIAESVIVPAKVIFLHPTKGYAILKYDPSVVDAPVQTPKFSTKNLERGDKVVFVGFNAGLRLITTETYVNDIGLVDLANTSAPRYKISNLEIVTVESSSALAASSGVLADTDGTVRAFWLQSDVQGEKVTMGLSAPDVMADLEFLKTGKKPDLKIVDVQYSSMSLSSARINGVPEEWIMKIQDVSKDRFRFLFILTVSTGLDNKPSCDLLAGDIILTINEKLITRLRDVDSVLREVSPETDNVIFKIVRQNKLLELTVKLTSTANFVTSQLAFFGGCAIQAPHHAVRQVISNLPSKVYTIAMYPGCPATLYDIEATCFITHVNEKPTPTLDEFLKVVRDVDENTYCKLRLVSFDGIPTALTLKVNYHYFPTLELKKDEAGDWQYITQS